MDKRHGLHCAAPAAILRLRHRGCSQRARLRQHHLPQPADSSHSQRTEEQKPQRKRHRQAAEIDGVVQVLCFSCRRAKDTTRQAGLASFFAPAAAAPAAAPAAADPDALLCSKCRRQMTKPAGPSASSSSASSRVLPQIQRLRAYQRIAEQQRVPFTISDAAATRLMMEPCCMCGAAPPTEGNGLTRAPRLAGALRAARSRRLHGAV